MRGQTKTETGGHTQVQLTAKPGSRGAMREVSGKQAKAQFLSNIAEKTTGLPFAVTGEIGGGSSRRKNSL